MKRLSRLPKPRVRRSNRRWGIFSSADLTPHVPATARPGKHERRAGEPGHLATLGGRWEYREPQVRGFDLELGNFLPPGAAVSAR